MAEDRKNLRILSKTLTEVLYILNFYGTGKTVQKLGVFIGFVWDS